MLIILGTVGNSGQASNFRYDISKSGFAIHPKCVFIGHEAIENKSVSRARLSIRRRIQFVFRELIFGQRLWLTVENVHESKIGNFRNLIYKCKPASLLKNPSRGISFVFANALNSYARPNSRVKVDDLTNTMLPFNVYHDPSALRLDEGLGIQQCGFRRRFRSFHRPQSQAYADESDNNQCNSGEVLRGKQTTEVACRLFGMVIFLPFGCWLIYHDDRPTRRFVRLLYRVGGFSFIGISLGLGFFPIYNQGCESDYQQPNSHSNKIVPRKQLTSNNYWGTVIDMANVLNTDKQIAVISALAEGSSIRSIERITGVHRDTIMRLGVRIGKGCAAVMDSKMRNLPCTRLEMDEIWGFVGKKERNVREGEDAVGSVWTFCAIDADTKLVPAFKVGDRSVATATAFVKDVADRMVYRVQISTDGLKAYVEAMENAFGGEVDYAQIIKTYGHEEVSNNRRYSAPEFVSSEKKIFVGNPDPRLISTSYIERLNATTRLHMRRLTRLTLAFSKKRENFEAAVALHFAYYNFVKRHNTIRCTPAMAAGVASSFWSVGDLVEAAA